MDKERLKLCTAEPAEEGARCSRAEIKMLDGGKHELDLSMCEGPVFVFSQLSHRPGVGGYQTLFCRRHLGLWAYGVEDICTAAIRASRKDEPKREPEPVKPPSISRSNGVKYLTVLNRACSFQTPAIKLPRKEDGSDWEVPRTLLVEFEDGPRLVWWNDSTTWQSRGYSAWRAGTLIVDHVEPQGKNGWSHKRINIVECDSNGYTGPTRLASILKERKVIAKVYEAMNGVVHDGDLVEKVLAEVKATHSIFIPKRTVNAAAQPRKRK